MVQRGDTDVASIERFTYDYEAHCWSSCWFLSDILLLLLLTMLCPLCYQCDGCALAKRKCDGKSTCSLCFKRGSPCVYSEVYIKKGSCLVVRILFSCSIRVYAHASFIWSIHLAAHGETYKQLEWSQMLKSPFPFSCVGFDISAVAFFLHKTPLFCCTISGDYMYNHLFFDSQMKCFISRVRNV